MVFEPMKGEIYTYKKSYLLRFPFAFIFLGASLVRDKNNKK